jgi:sodium borate transporter 11
VIYKISVEFNVDFFPMYACSGLWCQFFLIIYAFTELSNVMRYATRSTEEIFSLFIGVAFVVESFKAMQQSEGEFRFYLSSIFVRLPSVLQ